MKQCVPLITLDVYPASRYICHILLQRTIMRVLIGALAVAALAGCSLPASLVPGEPNVSEITAKVPKEYAQCVLPAWQRAIPKTTQVTISNGYRITAPSVVTADETLDIVKYKNGSRISLYQGPPWAKSSALMKSVHDCL